MAVHMSIYFGLEVRDHCSSWETRVAPFFERGLSEVPPSCLPQRWLVHHRARNAPDRITVQQTRVSDYATTQETQ